MQYEPQLQPRDYQLEALNRMSGRSEFALLMAMRTGKTKTLLDDYGRLELADQIDDLLVIAPKGVYRTWVGEMEKHLSKDLLSRLRIEVWKSGRKPTPGFLQMRGGPRVFLVNVEALSYSTTGARDACLQFLKGNRGMVAVDESTTIKTGSTKLAKFVLNHLAPQAACRRILSGLPTPRSPLDIFTQFEFLKPGLLGYRNWWDFRATHAITKRTLVGGRMLDLIVGYRYVDLLQQRIEPHAFRVEFRPDIPSTYSINEVEMTEEQQRLYTELKTYASAQLAEAGANVTATMVITQMLRMHQVLCGHVRDEEDNIHTVPDNKVNSLLELLEEYSGKAVIWASYDVDVRKIAEALALEYDESLVYYDDWGKERKKEPQFPNPVVARFWGGNPTTREEEELRFKEDPKCRFMVATPHAGGRGRTWSVADLVVYHSSTNNLEHRDQSEQRVQGVGKDRQVDYVDLITPGTIEEKILQALRAKMDLAGAITGDDWREWIV